MVLLNIAFFHSCLTFAGGLSATGPTVCQAFSCYSFASDYNLQERDGQIAHFNVLGPC